MKSNVDAEQKLYRMQGQLEKLRAEIKLEDDQEVWDENELLSEVYALARPSLLSVRPSHALYCARLRLKMYRGFGFTPVADDDGNYNKILVRTSSLSLSRAPLSLYIRRFLPTQVSLQDRVNRMKRSL